MKAEAEKKFTPWVIILFFLFSILTFKSHAQNGWVQGNWYVNQGAEDIICGDYFYVWNPYYRYNETWQKCTKRRWYQEYRSGYIYLWGPYGWYQEWREGYFWSFNWYNFNTKVR